MGLDGIATTSLPNTPLMDLIENFWGLENTYFLMQDCPQDVGLRVGEDAHRGRVVVERGRQLLPPEW